LGLRVKGEGLGLKIYLGFRVQGLGLEDHQWAASRLCCITGAYDAPTFCLELRV